MNDAATMRAAAAKDQPNAVPCGAARSQPFRSEIRAKTVDRDGQKFHQLDGVASVVERSYEMWDMFGPYTEVVSKGAFDETLAAHPDVVFLVNHRGLSMARTANGSLDLSVDAEGLQYTAYVNPKRTDVKDLVLAIEDGHVTESSFAFQITSGQWSPDYSEYRIEKVDLDRGDVSAVNYGANPYTSVAARSREILDDLEKLPAGAARAALERLQSREDVPQSEAEGSAEPEQVGRSTALVTSLLLADDE